MAYKQTLTNRVKFLISYLIGKGIAENQEDLGKKVNIDSKSYLSQLVNGKQNNTNFINKLMELAPEINIDWLYDESIESPFLEEIPQKSDIFEAGGITMYGVSKEEAQEVIDSLNAMVEMLKKDVKYHADIADSRLQTINIQNKYIDNLEAQLSKK